MWVESGPSRDASLIRDWHLYLWNLIHASPWKKWLIHHSELQPCYQICNWPLLRSLLDWREHIWRAKILSLCVFFHTGFFPLSHQRSVKWSLPSIYLLTWLTLNGSADNFSGSDEHLSLQLECIHACSHFVKGAIGWEKESSNCLRCGRNPFKLARFLSKSRWPS